MRPLQNFLAMQLGARRYPRIGTKLKRRRVMKTLVATALALVGYLAGKVLPQSTASAQTSRDAGQYYYQNGSQYYDGYPLRDWQNMRDRW